MPLIYEGVQYLLAEVRSSITVRILCTIMKCMYVNDRMQQVLLQAMLEPTALLSGIEACQGSAEQTTRTCRMNLIDWLFCVSLSTDLFLSIPPLHDRVRNVSLCECPTVRPPICFLYLQCSK